MFYIIRQNAINLPDNVYKKLKYNKVFKNANTDTCYRNDESIDLIDTYSGKRKRLYSK